MKYLLSCMLLIPQIILPMDWSWLRSSPSPSSPSRLPTQQNALSTQSHQLSNNNNNNTTEAPIDPVTTTRFLCRFLFADKLNENPDPTLTISLQEMKEAHDSFINSLGLHAHSLKGPNFYALEQHILALESAIGEVPPHYGIPFYVLVRDIEKTLDVYLNDPLRQREMLESSFYISPKNLPYPFNYYYINFCSAANAYIKSLESQDGEKEVIHLLETCNTLEAQFKELKNMNQPNVILTGNSKLATFASLCLKKISWLEQHPGIYNFEKANTKEMLHKWQALMPEHVGVEAAWGRNKYQEDRAILHIAKEKLGYDCFGVLDGHGGTDAAELAAQYLINDIISQENFNEALMGGDLKKLKPFLTNGFNICHQRMVQHNFFVAGTTATLAFIIAGNSPRVITAHVGDSEVYLAANNAPNLISLTKLHNTSEQTEIDKFNKRHPGISLPLHGRVNGLLKVTRALGEMESLREFVSHKPTIKQYPLTKGLLLIGSDGVFENNSSITKEEKNQHINQSILHNQDKFPGEIASTVISQIKPYDGDNKMLMVIKLDPYVHQS